jgi:hypothetical protein
MHSSIDKPKKRVRVFVIAKEGALAVVEEAMERSSTLAAIREGR